MLAVSLCASVIFAKFSYPLKYPLASVIGIVAMWRVCAGMSGRIKMNEWGWRWVGMAGVVVSVVALNMNGAGWLAVPCTGIPVK